MRSYGRNLMKAKSIVVLKDAVDDLKAGRTFYNRMEPGIGDYFWDSLIADIESLVIYAGVHTKRYGFYRMFSKRFPYAIYYELKDDIAFVAAILPMRRDPDWAKKGLERRS